MLLCYLLSQIYFWRSSTWRPGKRLLCFVSTRLCNPVEFVTFSSHIFVLCPYLETLYFIDSSLQCFHYLFMTLKGTCSNHVSRINSMKVLVLKHFLPVCIFRHGRGLPERILLWQSQWFLELQGPSCLPVKLWRFF